MTKSLKDWSASVVTGGKPLHFTHCRGSGTIFSKDGRYCIVLLSHQIRVYFMSTRQCTRSIEVDLADVSDARIDESNESHILLFRESGEVLAVNWKEKVAQPVVSSIRLELEFPLLSVIRLNQDVAYVVCGKTGRNSSSHTTRYVYQVSLDSKRANLLVKAEDVLRQAVSMSEKKFAFVKSNHEVCLVDLTEIYNHIENSESKTEKFGESELKYINSMVETSSETISFPYKSPITSFAVSDDSVVAIGTMHGAIQILYGGSLSDTPQKLLKWHLDSVKALHFSADNNYLLSGGQEKVLVLWQLETNKTQFLPRLNGVIDKISIDKNKDDHYNLMLNIPASSNSHSGSDKNYELLSISAVDLISRLSFNSINPKFANDLSSTLPKTQKKYSKQKSEFDMYRMKYDYSSIFQVHPKTNELYIPNESNIQAYNLTKNEQSFVQSAAPTLQTGKVRSELSLLNPEISLISFTHNGDWMCTFDTTFTPEVDNLISKEDIQYSLKFWKFVENKSVSNASKMENNSINNKVGYWELSTKIIDPHGTSNKVLAIKEAPTSYHGGLAFLSIDEKGGLRVWRPRIPKEIYQSMKGNHKLQQTAWTLRNSFPYFASASDAVDACWSEDGSIIFFAHECSIRLIDSGSFEEILDSSFKLPALSGSRIRAIDTVDNNLIILSKTRISSFNLLMNQMNDLVAQVKTTVGGKNLFSIDHMRNIICLAVNYYEEINGELKIKSKIMLFKPQSLQPIFVSYHSQGLSSVRYGINSFIFIDLDCRVGVIQYSGIEDEKEESLADRMNSILLTAGTTADLINKQNVEIKSNGSVSNIAENNYKTNKVLDVNVIQPVFENIEGISMDAIYERVLKVIK